MITTVYHMINYGSSNLILDYSSGCSSSVVHVVRFFVFCLFVCVFLDANVSLTVFTIVYKHVQNGLWLNLSGKLFMNFERCGD